MIDWESQEWLRMYAYRRAASGARPLPRWFRKMMAKSVWHRAWHQGHIGSFLLPVLERN